MSDLIFWMAVPLLLAPVLATRGRVGAAVAQLIVAGLGVAALRQGAGTLDPGELQTIATQSAHDGWFVGITAGALLTGACLSADVRNWRVLLLGTPLAAVLLWISMTLPRPLIVGAVIGGIPFAAGQLIVRSRAVTAVPAGASPRVAGRTFSALLPILGVVAHLVAAHAFPEVTEHWQPLFSTLLVIAALATASRQRWDGAAIALMLLAATRSGATPFVVGMLFSLAPTIRRFAPGARTLGLAAAVSVALLVTVLLRDQVLLSVVLALGLAAIAQGTIVIVAPVSVRDHL